MSLVNISTFSKRLFPLAVSSNLDAGFKPKVKQEAAWISTVLSLVAGGMGISLLPANVQNLQRGGVIYRSIQGKSPSLELVAVWRSDHVSIILENFLEVISNLA